jgi:hypothetical protein
VFVILAKRSGEDFLRGIAQWVKERQPERAQVLGYPVPSPRTIRRICPRIASSSFRWVSNTETLA